MDMVLLIIFIGVVIAMLAQIPWPVWLILVLIILFGANKN